MPGAFCLNAGLRATMTVDFARHKQWFGTMLPQCHALAARITLTVQKELQMLAVKTGVSAGQLRAAASASQGVASGALLQIPSPMTMSSEDEE